MNVNPESARFTEVVAWDSLSDAEKASGDWIQLPDVSGEPRQARKRSMIEKAFGSAPARAIDPEFLSHKQRMVEDALDAVWSGRKR